MRTLPDDKGSPKNSRGNPKTCEPAPPAIYWRRKRAKPNAQKAAKPAEN
jgi:hypothetical protein